ncbi:single-stranded DNA-binding protein [Caniella muris]|uniref:single-stranded DNA-binding protein n=1 Tax=Caniella muris TaxID=2941502 RepID=UPI00203E0A71|nr:single-stranded DNA-binding protein [Caniella muris]
MSVNRVCITGNLTRDPELQATQSSTDVLRIGVAVNDRWRNPQTDQWEDRPNFVDCVLFGNRARALAPILAKGMKVAVEGRLRWSQWQDRETGKNRSKLEVVVDEVDLMQRRDDGAGPASAPAAAYADNPSQPQAVFAPAEPPAAPAFAEDIPF